jgi:3-oxochol-4-en-24-oyl-CoA dehydrogenase
VLTGGHVVQSGLTEEQALLVDAATDFLSRRAPVDSLDLREFPGTPGPTSFWKEMAELGWLGLLIPEALGGSGGTVSDVEVLSECMGGVLLPPPFVASAVATAAALLCVRGCSEADQILGSLCVGTSVPVLVAGGLEGTWDDNVQLIEMTGGKLYGSAAFVEGAAEADIYVVLADRADGPELVVVRRTTQVLVEHQSAMVRGAWSSVHFDGAAGNAIGGSREAVDTALSHVAVAAAGWCAGAGQSLLSRTVDYVSSRVAFGRPVGSFQAVQHSLADCATALAEATSLARHAARALDETSADSARMASIAFVRSTTAFVEVSRRCHQVWGGMGFTRESQVHHYSRRAKWMQMSWGGAHYHRDVIGKALHDREVVLRRYVATTSSDNDRPSATNEPIGDLDEFKDQVRDLLTECYDPAIERQSILPQMDTPEKERFAKRLASRGWLGLAWPQQYGGKGLNPLYQIVLQSELEYVRHPSLAFEVGLVGQTLLHHGNEALKAEFLPRIVSADLRVALGYSEPEGGSDLAALKTRAVRDGDEFVVDGQKMWTTSAHFADVIWLAVRTDPEAEKHRGISVLMVDANSPGVQITPVETMVGETHRTNMVFFDQVRVPSYRLVGAINNGWTYMMEALNYERVSGAPFGGLQRDLDELLIWLQDNPDADLAMWDLLAEMDIRVESTRSHLLRSMDCMANDDVPIIDATMLKIKMSETRQWMADQVIDSLGPRGLLSSESPHAPMGGHFEETWQTEIVTTIAGGANEVLRDLIARRLLHLPVYR